ncbi:hypothetical protein [Catenovulum agarivorans]|uniref:hypothetical protein n=1 Tax=Catenovulum agarivorans TaxID=1172192 RepID=UPI0002FE9AA9|nr:hypothetical protein [Catenovulum agarivorans]
MKKLALIVAIGVGTLASCTTIHSNPATWKNNNKVEQFHAEYRVGLTGRQIVIFHNDKEIMSKKGKWWSSRLTMTTTLDGKPVSAECGGGEAKRSCVVRVEGEKIADLVF